MIRAECPEVLRIARIESSKTVWVFSEEDLLRFLRARDCVGKVAKRDPDQKILGFMIYQLHRNGFFLSAFAVDPEYRGLGVGQVLVDDLKRRLSPGRRTAIGLIVRESDLQSQIYFRGLGFLAIRTVAGHFKDTSEDGILMDYSIPEEPAGLEELLALPEAVPLEDFRRTDPERDLARLRAA